MNAMREVVFHLCTLDAAMKNTPHSNHALGIGTSMRQSIEATMGSDEGMGFNLCEYPRTYGPIPPYCEKSPMPLGMDVNPITL